MNIKVCGITRMEDALLSVHLGAWALGFNFYEKSPRFITPDNARAIIAKLPNAVVTVGIFVNAPQDTITKTLKATGIQVAQLHGDETPKFVAEMRVPMIKAVRTKPAERFDVETYLVDANKDDMYGGTGKLANWKLAVEMKALGQVILAGGLDPSNVEKAIREVNPFAVDVNSGVEVSPGIKDAVLLREFFERSKSASR